MKNLIAAVVLLCTVGCTANLQRPYVESMEETRKAIMLDVKAGDYKPDARSAKTLDAWKTANEDALTALIEQEKK